MFKQNQGVEKEGNVKSELAGLESGGQTESQKFVEENYDKLIANNVVKDDSQMRLPEGDGLLVDGTMLKNLNESQSKVEDDILADMESSGKRGKKKKKSRKESRKNSKSSSNIFFNEDKQKGKNGKEDDVVSSKS